MTTNRWSLRPLLAGLLVSLALLGACRDGPLSLSPEPELATLRVSANVSGTFVTAVAITVTAADFPSPLVFNLDLQNGVASGTLRVPTGPARTFTGSAFAANGEITHEGSLTVDVRRGENPPLQLILLPTSGEVPIVLTLARFSVEISPAEVQLPLGRTLQLVATIRDANGNVVQGQVVWASLNPAFATVGSTGTVTARRLGEVQVVASYAGMVGSARIIIVENTFRQIAFVSYRLGGPPVNPQIYIMDEDGSNVRRLSYYGGTDMRPSWSPDGSRIAFSRSSPGARICIMNADGSNVHCLTEPPALDTDPSWSPDGSRIAFSREHGYFPGNLNNEICVMDADGSNVQRLTDNPANDRAPSWSPDGNRIAFMSNRDGNYEIYVMDADGSNPTRLTNSPALDSDPRWSPDGSRIAFTSNRDGHGEIYLMDADGSDVRRLTDGRGWYPAWSPDGSRIAFTSNRDGHEDIYVMNADGSNVQRVTDHPLPDFMPAWQP